jgi:hypothetical protein
LLDRATARIIIGMTTVADIRRKALRSLIPPPRLQLSEWIEGGRAS